MAKKVTCSRCNSETFLRPYNPRFMAYCPNRCEIGHFENDIFKVEGIVKKYGIELKQPYTCNKCGAVKR